MMAVVAGVLIAGLLALLASVALLVGFGVVFVHETKSPDSAPSTNQKITSIGRMNTALEGNTNAMTVLCSARM